METILRGKEAFLHWNSLVSRYCRVIVVGFATHLDNLGRLLRGQVTFGGLDRGNGLRLAAVEASGRFTPHSISRNGRGQKSGKTLCRFFFAKSLKKAFHRILSNTDICSESFITDVGEIYCCYYSAPTVWLDLANFAILCKMSKSLIHFRVNSITGLNSFEPTLATFFMKIIK